MGKNKTSSSASEDYAAGVKLFGSLADYLAINISNPTTPGLRSLQEKEDFRLLIKAVLLARKELGLSHPPILAGQLHLRTVSRTSAFKLNKLGAGQSYLSLCVSYKNLPV